MKRVVDILANDLDMDYFSPMLAPDGQTLVFSAFTQDDSGFCGERADIHRISRSDVGNLWLDTSAAVSA